MRTLRVNEVTYGKSYADMINKAIGTNYCEFYRSGVDMEPFGAPGVIAWFVLMNGTENGYRDGWSWRNYLSPDGNFIREYNVSQSKEKVIAKQKKEGFSPYRLCFQLDPYGNGDRNCCKFVGAFALTNFLRQDLSAMKHTKIMETFKIGAKGEYGGYLNDKSDLANKINSYNLPIEQLGFSDPTLKKLKSGHVSRAGELLELEFEGNGQFADEIRRKLFQCFGERS